MLEMEPLSRALGAVALGVVLAGCSLSAAPSEPEEVVSTARVSTLEQPDVSAPSEMESADSSSGDVDPWDGYVEVGHGTWIPAGGPGDCNGSAYIFIGKVGGASIAEVLLPENLVDMGSRRFAQGEVGYDGQGRIATYTVAAGDVEGVIGERLCFSNGELIGMLNGHNLDEPIRPGEVLVIDPEVVPGFEYKDPFD